MKKTILAMISFLILVISLLISGGTEFKEGKNHIFYLYSASSNAAIRRLDENAVRYSVFLGEKRGESCELDEADLPKVLKRLKADLVFDEKGEFFENKYYYSPKIKGNIMIKGQRVNLHVSKRDGKIYIASPLNFGSF